MAAERVIMPKLGLYSEDVLLCEWLKAEGAQVRRGETLFSLETDKVTSDVEAEADGFLHHLVEAGEKVPIGGEIGLIAASREEYELLAGDHGVDSSHPFLGYIDRGGGASVAQPAAARASSALATARRGRGGGPPISPRARALMAREGVTVEEAAALAGTGPGGRITDRDVLAYLESRTPETTEVAQRIPLTGKRATIAARLQQGLQIAAQLTSVLELDVSTIDAWRQQAKARGDAAPGYTAIFVQLLAQALRRHPPLNSRLAGDVWEVLARVNVGVAVDTPEGVVVPVVHDADRLPLGDIQTRVADVVARARANALALRTSREGRSRSPTAACTRSTSRPRS
jgi:pyruvate/2-oxoglutarate dehydrogenase complex dihydrolipoamide acyltransferase (E2) component